MKIKILSVGLALLLSTSSYAMESVFIAEDFSSQCAHTKTTYSQAFSPLCRFLNDDFVSNLRFLCGQKQWNPALSGHFQSALCQSFPIDSMTQLTHLLFPSPTGDYLVANQSTDIIAKTKALKFYDALVNMRANGAPDIWDLFEFLFDRQLSPFAKDIIIAEINGFYIEEYANAIRKEAAQYNEPIEVIMKYLQEDGFFQDGFLASKAGRSFKTALKGGNPVRQKIREALPQKVKNLNDTLINLKHNSHKRPKIEAELEELSQLDASYVTKHDFQGYQIAYAFMNAFVQEQNGIYSAGTLERIIATYMWQKAETVDDLPFLSGALVTDHEVIKGQIKPLMEQSDLLQSYYDAGRYDAIWAYIYRERLMLDAKHVPIIKYRTTTVDGISIPDCFETAMHNAADFLCFINGAFDPSIWKEESELYQYFSELKYTTPNAPKARSKWAAAVAKKKDARIEKDVLYYTPSKKMNDVNNTIEAVPGIINMFKIMAHLGNATDATWQHLAQLGMLSETNADEQLSAAFQLLMTDITQGQIVFDRVNCSGISSISDRLAGYSDFIGNLNAIVKDKLPFEWQFMHKHSIFKCDTPVQQYNNDLALLLSQLPLFKDLRSHYTDLKTFIVPEMTHAELTHLLMESDLRSPDLRREIMPILLELHLDLPLIENILKLIEKEDDQYEVKEVIKLFNKNINVWLDDPIKRPIVMGLMRSAPKLFATETGFQGDLEYRVLYRSLIERFKEKNDVDAEVLAIELMQKAPNICFFCEGNDPIMHYVHYFKNAKSLSNVSLFGKANELFDFTAFGKLKSIGLKMSNNPVHPQTADEEDTLPLLSLNQVDEFVGKMVTSIDYVSFSGADTIKQLSNAYAIFHKMKETRPQLDIYLNANISIEKIMQLRISNPALFEWAASEVSYINDMTFLQHEDYMHFFTNVIGLNNFQITNEDGTMNRSILSKLSHFNKVTWLHISCLKWDQSIPDNTSDTTSFDVIVDQLPRSLQNVSFYNLYSVNLDDFETFVETLATKKPNLRIEMNRAKTILEGRSRMMELVNSGRIIAN